MPPKTPPAESPAESPAEPPAASETPRQAPRAAKVAPRVGKKQAPKPRRISLFATPAERWEMMKRIAADLEFAPASPEMKADA